MDPEGDLKDPGPHINIIIIIPNIIFNIRIPIVGSYRPYHLDIRVLNGILTGESPPNLSPMGTVPLNPIKTNMRSASIPT